MLNINQNFDLKAPVFNFDRDYFNSVEELNAYNTNNIPNHFVTNVAGMLYQFTDGKWLPIISTKSDDKFENEYNIYLGGQHCYIHTNANDYYSFNIGSSEDYSSISGSSIYMYSDTEYDKPNITIHNRTNGTIKNMCIGKTGNEYGLNIRKEEDNYIGNIKILTDRKLTGEELELGYSQLGISLTEHSQDYLGTYIQTVDITPGSGFVHNDVFGYTAILVGNVLNITDNNSSMSYLGDRSLQFLKFGTGEMRLFIGPDDDGYYYIAMGSDEKFKIFRPEDNTEGATITGVKSIVAFANPSATKVWATDGSTIDLTTKANASDLDAKANASDVLLKKSASGGYYIEENSNELGKKAFAANDKCTASGGCSFAEGQNTTASGNSSHTEGYNTTASGTSSHAEGEDTIANGSYAHAEGKKTKAYNSSHAEGWGTNASGFTAHTEGDNTIASGYCSHAQGCYNVENINAIHSVGIGPSGNRKNAEYIYAKNNKYGSALVDDPKNGYKYLIGVGGYDGISTDNSTYKSVQEVIADLTARIEQLEKLTANCVSISNVDEQTN